MKIKSLLPLFTIHFLFCFKGSESDDIDTIGDAYHTRLQQIEINISRPVLMDEYNIYITKISSTLLNANRNIRFDTIIFTKVTFIICFSILISYKYRDLNIIRNDLWMKYTFTQIEFKENSQDHTFDVNFFRSYESIEFSYIDLSEFELYHTDFSILTRNIASYIISGIETDIAYFVDKYPLSQGEFDFQDFIIRLSGYSNKSIVYQCEVTLNESEKIINFSFDTFKYEYKTKFVSFGLGFLNVDIGIEYTIASDKDLSGLHSNIRFDKIVYIPGKIDVSDAGTGDKEIRSLVKDRLIYQAKRLG